MLNKITSFTTDNGTEIGLGVVPGVMGAFLRRLRGLPWDICKSCIIEGSRLCPFSLRVPDWGHMCSTLMKMAAQELDGWPEILSALRHLTKFFRNGSWRDDIRKKLKHRVDNIDELLKTFKGTFLKWRYSTLYDNMSALNRLRTLCEVELVHLQQMMPNFQDAVLLQQVVAACNWQRLWVLISVFCQRVLAPIEFLRRWGLDCACHRDFRREFPGKKYECSRKGRRLGDARERVGKCAGQLTDAGQSLQLNQCENDQWVYLQVSNSARKVCVMLVRKGGYLKVVPHLMSECLKPAQAKACREQLLALEDAKCGQLELFHKSLTPDLEAPLFKGLRLMPPTPKVKILKDVLSVVGGRRRGGMGWRGMDGGRSKTHIQLYLTFVSKSSGNNSRNIPKHPQTSPNITN